MKTEIRVKHGDLQKIALKMGMTYSMISKHLKGEVYSKSSEKTRELAIKEFNGVEIK